METLKLAALFQPQTPLLFQKVNQYDHMFGIFSRKDEYWNIWKKKHILLSDRKFSFRNYRTPGSTNKRHIGQICQRDTTLRPAVHIKQLLDSSLLAQVDLQESQLLLQVCPALAFPPRCCPSPGITSRHRLCPLCLGSTQLRCLFNQLIP